jgi:phospholipid/cholesterol/gamma-HCH transport system ATP-binding protein
MRKRASLARALALDPELLFFDEPSAGLDPVTSEGLDRLILALRARLGMSLVIVTHEPASIRRLADRIVFLDEGRVVYDGPLAGVGGAGAAVRRFFEAAAQSR